MFELTRKQLRLGKSAQFPQHFEHARNLDDLLVLGQPRKQHRAHTCTVFDRLSKHGIKIKV